jgi:hypothetical protein
MNAAKNSFMKKIDCTMSEKNIKRRPRADSSKICINVKIKKERILLLVLKAGSILYQQYYAVMILVQGF